MGPGTSPPRTYRRLLPGAELPTPATHDRVRTHNFGATLAAARRGQASAIDELAAHFYPTVQRIVHHRLATDLRSSRPWLAARFSTGDVVQEVFQGVLRDLDAFAGETEQAFIGYLAMVVRNRIIDAVRFHEADCRDGRRTGRVPTQLDVHEEAPTPRTSPPRPSRSNASSRR